SAGPPPVRPSQALRPPRGGPASRAAPRCPAPPRPAPAWRGPRPSRACATGSVPGGGVSRRARPARSPPTRWPTARPGAPAAPPPRVLNGLGAVWMGLALGPVGLVAAYLVTYCLHGACGPAYQTLLHREASARNRATVLSLASMLAFAAFSVASPVLGVLADL